MNLTTIQSAAGGNVSEQLWIEGYGSVNVQSEAKAVNRPNDMTFISTCTSPICNCHRSRGMLLIHGLRTSISINLLFGQVMVAFIPRHSFGPLPGQKPERPMC